MSEHWEIERERRSIAEWEASMGDDEVAVRAVPIETALRVTCPRCGSPRGSSCRSDNPRLDAFAREPWSHLERRAEALGLRWDRVIAGRLDLSPRAA